MNADPRETIRLAAEASHDYEEAAHAETLGMTEALRAVLAEIPDPEDEGYCDHCGKRLELVQVQRQCKDGPYTAHIWRHTDRCWYGKVQQALGVFADTK